LIVHLFINGLGKYLKLPAPSNICHLKRNQKVKV